MYGLETRYDGLRCVINEVWCDECKGRRVIRCKAPDVLQPVRRPQCSFIEEVAEARFGGYRLERLAKGELEEANEVQVAS